MKQESRRVYVVRSVKLTQHALKVLDISLNLVRWRGFFLFVGLRYINCMDFLDWWSQKKKKKKTKKDMDPHLS